MLKPKIQDALNDQINAELYSSYLYYAMAGYYESIDLPGHASWMRVQAQEELFHVNKFYSYIVEKDGRIDMKPIDGPPNEWESAVDAMTKAHEHEHIVSDRINKLVDLARDESDHATYNFLQWFVDEQVEEEASTQDAVRKLKMVGTDGAGLYMVDNEMAARAFVYPPGGGAAE